MRRLGALASCAWFALALGVGRNHAQSPASVLVVVNDNSPISRSVAEYYAHRRMIPLSNVCHIRASIHEDIDRAAYDRDIAAPIGAFLKKSGLVQSIFYIVTTSGFPLRIEGTSGLGGNAASVDSELAALYFDLTQGKPHPVDGSLQNPFFGKNQLAFRHPEFPMYLVTRLTPMMSRASSELWICPCARRIEVRS